LRRQMKIHWRLLDATNNCASENPASTNSTIESLVRLLVFSSFAVVPPASDGGLIIRTVALPVNVLSPEAEPLPVRLRLLCLAPVLEPKMFVDPSELFVSPVLGSSFELKSGSSPHDWSSAGTSFPS